MFKKVSEAYSVLSNEERRSFFDKHGMSPEDAENDQNFTGGLDDLFNTMFGGGKGGTTFTFSMDSDFDDFINILEGGDNKSFKKMFQDMGKGYRKKGNASSKAVRQGRQGRKGPGMSKVE